MTMLKDGTGQGFRARIDQNNRIATNTIVGSRELDATEDGNAYQIVSARVTLTTANPSGLLYIQNLDSTSFVLDRVVFLWGSSTGGAGNDLGFQTQRNPTGGTLISNAVAAGVSNSNHASAKTPNSLQYRGVEGDTLTGGTGVTLPLKDTGGRQLFPLNRVLGQGSSIGWVVTPPSGNTSLDVVIVAHMYFDQNRVSGE